MTTANMHITVEYYRGEFWQGQVTDDMSDAEMDAHQDRYLDLVEQCIRDTVGLGVDVRINDHAGVGARRVNSDIDGAESIADGCFESVFNSGAWFQPIA